MTDFPDVTIPDNWHARKRAVLEERWFADPGHKVMHVIGIEVEREQCGCTFLMGMRLDRHEMTSGFAPCAEHKPECTLAINALQTMPGQDMPVIELAIDLLEKAIAS